VNRRIASLITSRAIIINNKAAWTVGPGEWNLELGQALNEGMEWNGMDGFPGVDKLEGNVRKNLTNSSLNITFIPTTQTTDPLDRLTPKRASTNRILVWLNDPG